jgi:hypothetical protein
MRTRLVIQVELNEQKLGVLSMYSVPKINLINKYLS